MDVAGDALNFRDHGLIAQQVGNLKLGNTGLACTQQLTGAANFQILLSNNKAVVAVAQHL